jgi:hypothetical protein
MTRGGLIIILLFNLASLILIYILVRLIVW